MTNLKSRSLYLSRKTIGAMTRSPGRNLVAIATIAVSLLLLAVFAALLGGIRSAADLLARDVVFAVYVPRTLSDAASQALRASVESLDGVSEARLIGSEAALGLLRAGLGQDASLLAGLPEDVIPPSLEVRLVSRPWSTEQLRSLTDRIAKLDGVEEVRSNAADLARLSSVLAIVRTGAWVLGLVLCASTILIITSTIHLTMHARRDEIEVMSLVGASPAFLRAPFVLEGALQGLLGAVAAVAACWALRGALELLVRESLTAAAIPSAAQEVSGAWIAGMIPAGILLGVAGALLAVGRFEEV